MYTVCVKKLDALPVILMQVFHQLIAGGILAKHQKRSVGLLWRRTDGPGASWFAIHQRVAIVVVFCELKYFFIISSLYN